MAKTLANLLTKMISKTVSNLLTASGRRDFINDVFISAVSSNLTLPGQTQMLSLLRTVGSGITQSEFKQLYRVYSNTTKETVKQFRYDTSDVLPRNVIPESDFDLTTEYLHKFVIPTFNPTTGKWEDTFASIGTDRRISADQALQEFLDNFVDKDSAGNMSYYSAKVDRTGIKWIGTYRTPR